VSVDIEAAVPAARLEPSFKLWLAILVGAAAISAACLAFLEADAGRKEDRALVDASRSGIDVFVKLGASGPRFQFELNAARESTLLDARASARAAATSVESLPLQVAISSSLAENATARRLLEISERLARLPDSAPELDAAASESLRVRSASDVEPIYAAQEASLADAETYGARQQRSMYGLSLIAVAASLLGLAGLLGSGRGGRIALATAAGTLLVAVGIGASGLLL
jgi:hypothetical protein